MIAGATTVGVGTALFYDPLACRKINAGIAEYMARHKFSTIADIVGSLQA
jgi:dihydroorotate dehydrogenase (NAD+) catalytic subunit